MNKNGDGCMNTALEMEHFDMRDGHIAFLLNAYILIIVVA